MLISTGKSDWPRDVESESGSLAHFLDAAISAAPRPPKPAAAADGKAVAGVYNAVEMSKITILNGSHYTLSDDPKHDTVLVLPDYKVLTEVPRSLEGAQQLYKDAVNPILGRAGAAREAREETEIKSWILPYSCVILLCKSPFATSS